MKKIFLLMFAAAAALGSWATDEVTATFTSNKLDVALTNSTEFVAFQMDITLDTSVTVSNLVAADRLAKGEDVMIGGISCTTEFQLLSNQISVAGDKQVIRVIAYNLGNNAITLNEGTIFTADLSGEPTAVTFDNIRFVNKAGLEEAILEYTEAQKATDTLLGDINNDGEISNNDLIALVDILTNGTAGANYSSYNHKAADLNGDEEITMNDLLALLNLL